MNTFFMITEVSYGKTVFILTFVCIITLSSAYDDCIKDCVNGNCDVSGICVCDPCWDGSNCDKYNDNYIPAFDVSEKRLFINRQHINRNKSIFLAKASDKDLSITCNGRTKDCQCATVIYRLKYPNEYDGLFMINSETGALYTPNPEKIIDGHRYIIIVEAYNKNNTQSGTLKLTIVVENELHRIRRDTESVDINEIKSVNNEPLSKQITNFQTTFNLKTLSGDSNTLIAGNTIQYRLDVSLPRTTGMDLMVELYTKDAVNPLYSPALTLYNISVGSAVAGIGFGNGHPPKPVKHVSDIINTIYDHVILDFGSVSNNGADGNKLAIFFSVAMVKNPNVTVGSKHYVTVGTEYNHASFVWVGQSQVTTAALLPADDIRIADGDLKGPETIPLDSGAIFTVNTYLEFRSDPVILEISGPSHDYEPDNVISMGQIGIIHFGNSYQTIPNIPQHYVTKRIDSESRLSFTKAILDMGLVTNIGEKTGRASSNAGNKLSFTFSIYATNYEQNVGKTVPINVALLIGGRTVWSNSVTVKITEQKNEKSTGRMINSNASYAPAKGSPGSITTMIIETEFDESSSFTDFSVQLEVPTSRKLPLLEPCSARFVKERLGFNIPYANTKQLEPIVEGNQFTFNFGRIHNVKQRVQSKREENAIVAEIVLKIAFHEENIEGKTLTASVKVNGGDKSIKVKVSDIMIDADKKPSEPLMTREKSIPWNDLYIDGAIAVNVEMTLPIGISYETVKFEIMGDNDTALALPDANICRFEVVKVGDSMPCTCVGIEKINRNSVSYQRSFNKNSSLNNNDHAIMSFGDVSVLQTESKEIERKIMMNFVATIVDGVPFTNGNEYPFIISATIGSTNIWSSTIQFPIKMGQPPELSEDKRPLLTAKLEKDLSVIPGFTTDVEIKLKIAPNSISSYSLEVNAGDDEVSICGLWISHIGKNMPCLNDDVKAEYEMRKIGENNRANITFKLIANTGPTHLLSPSDEEYANTIKFTAMVRIKNSASADKAINVIAKYGNRDNKLTHHVNIPLKMETLSKHTFIAPKVFNFTAENSAKIAAIGAPMLLNFDIELDKNLQAPIKASLINPKGYEICDAAIVHIGENYPCLSPFDLKKNINSSTFDLGMVCNTFLNQKDQNKVRLAIAIRFNNDLKEGKSLKIMSQGYVGESLIGEKQTIDMTIKKDIDQQMGSDDRKPIIKPTHVTPLVTKIRQNVWVPFNLTIPPQSTIHVMVEARGATDNNRAVITVHGLRIASGGSNIACPLANQFPSVTFESSNKNSQNDVVKADLGYFANYGFTHAFDNAIPGDDDVTIEVLAQFTDHPVTDENSDHTLKMTVTLGNGQNSQNISAAKFLRVHRLGNERPRIDTEVIINNSSVYDRNQTIVASMRIRHNNQSLGEPSNTALRLFFPSYITFGDLISSNTKELPMVKNGSVTSSVDIIFPWILFPDDFVVNFTMIVDPNNQRGYGQNATATVTPYRMMCEHFRVSLSSKFPCSKLNGYTYSAISSECNNPLGMGNGHIKDCQITASSSVNINYAPYLGRFGSSQYWAPSLRFTDTKQYLEIDFLSKTRVTKVAIQTVKGTRKIVAYRLMSSDNGQTWEKVNDVSYFSYGDGTAEDLIKHPHESRYYRFIIEEVADSAKENDAYIGVRIEFYGCYLESQESAASCNSIDKTLYSDDNEKPNRHFSVDPYLNNMFVCDSTSDLRDNMCYHSNSGGSTWKTVGQSIDLIEGYDTTGKFYGVDLKRMAYLSTRDGIKWTPVNYDQFNRTVTNQKFFRRVNVPALHKEGIRRMNLKVGNWKALYDGLYFEDGSVPKILWGKCCKS